MVAVISPSLSFRVISSSHSLSRPLMYEVDNPPSTTQLGPQSHDVSNSMRCTSLCSIKPLFSLPTYLPVQRGRRDSRKSLSSNKVEGDSIRTYVEMVEMIAEKQKSYMIE